MCVCLQINKMLTDLLPVEIVYKILGYAYGDKTCMDRVIHQFKTRLVLMDLDWVLGEVDDEYLEEEGLYREMFAHFSNMEDATNMLTYRGCAYQLRHLRPTTYYRKWLPTAYIYEEDDY